MAHNGGQSLTSGGPMFHLLSLADLDDGVANPFDDLTVTRNLLVQPAYAAPGSVPAQEMETIIRSWSDIVWIHLGGSSDLPVPPLGGNPRDANNEDTEVTRIQEKDFRLFDRTQARWRIFLAADPAPGTLAVIPILTADVSTYLGLAPGAQAAEDLQEMVDTSIRTCNSSRDCAKKHVTFRKECVTLAFSNRVRTFGLASNLLVNLTLKHVQDHLGLLQFLTPVASALACVAEGDSHACTMVMANAVDTKLLTAAMEKSKVYCSGHIETFRHLYEAFCNFRMFLRLMVGSVDNSIVKPLHCDRKKVTV